MTKVPKCHPDRPYAAKGLCSACYQKQRRQANPRVKDVEKAWQAANVEQVRESKRRWARQNSAHLTAYKRKRLENPEHRLANNMRGRLYKALRRNSSGKSISAVKDLGCSIPKFMLYVENQFQDGMSWDNYGEWHLDHVIPVSSFDLSYESQTKEAFNWLNYQPLWAKDNRIKYNKLEKIQWQFQEPAN